MIGAAPFHESQVVGVIDDAGEIRVLVVNPDRHAMPTVANRAVGPSRSRIVHLRNSSSMSMRPSITRTTTLPRRNRTAETAWNRARVRRDRGGERHAMSAAGPAGYAA